MTAGQKSRLGQGLTFGVFFILLGSLMRYLSEGRTSTFYGGTVAIVLGSFIMIWGAFALRKPATQSNES